MPLPDPQQVIDIVRDTAEKTILPRFRRLADEDISEKSPGDIVTIADVESEQRLEAALTKLVPGSRCVGEEAAENNPDVLRLLDGEAPVWVIDPLDGTRNFANGRSPFAVIVAYCLGGETLMGWIHNPVSGDMVWAGRGQGAWDGNGERRYISPPVAVSAMKGSLSKAGASKIVGAKGAPRHISRVGCVGQDYLDLSSGALHFARYAVTLKPWDHAAGVLIHQETGGYSCLVRSGKPYTPVLDADTARSDMEVLMMTPDIESWKQLASMLGDL